VRGNNDEIKFTTTHLDFSQPYLAKMDQNRPGQAGQATTITLKNVCGNQRAKAIAARRVPTVHIGSHRTLLIVQLSNLKLKLVAATALYYQPSHPSLSSDTYYRL
jgi:hypothetical protein